MTKEVLEQADAKVAKRERRTFSEQQKMDIVREALAAGPGKGSAIAIQHGLAPNLLYRWIDAYKDEVSREPPVAFESVPVAASADVQKLQAENARLKAMLAEYLLKEKLGN